MAKISLLLNGMFSNLFNKGVDMIQLALILFIMAFLTVIAGASGLEVMTVGVAKNLAMVFIILGVISYLGSLSNKKRDRLL
jgi:uncharacterized membrane protein YtjA (UPF0391 family)